VSSPVPMLNMDLVNALKVATPDSKHVDLTLIGTGGTGSWLAPTIVRIARMLNEGFGKSVTVTFMDPDRVEPKNVYRQFFSTAEIGHFKAEALAFRYGAAWGVDIRAVTCRLDERFSFNSTGYGDLRVMIGCVDNNKARRTISRLVYNQPRLTYWLDCGNGKSSGQVLFGGAASSNLFPLPGFCAWLPWPDQLAPDLIVGEPESNSSGIAPHCTSCADMIMHDVQGMTVNQTIAAWAGDYLFRFLVTRNLDRYRTYFDLASGTAISQYPTERFLRDEWKRITGKVWRTPKADQGRAQSENDGDEEFNDEEE
jgi:PRTRC genetic system ThiF family protein